MPKLTTNYELLKWIQQLHLPNDNKTFHHQFIQAMLCIISFLLCCGRIQSAKYEEDGTMATFKWLSFQDFTRIIHRRPGSQDPPQGQWIFVKRSNLNYPDIIPMLSILSPCLQVLLPGSNKHENKILLKNKINYEERAMDKLKLLYQSIFVCSFFLLSFQTTKHLCMCPTLCMFRWFKLITLHTQ